MNFPTSPLFIPGLDLLRVMTLIALTLGVVNVVGLAAPRIYHLRTRNSSLNPLAHASYLDRFEEYRRAKNFKVGAMEIYRQVRSQLDVLDTQLRGKDLTEYEIAKSIMSSINRRSSVEIPLMKMYHVYERLRFGRIIDGEQEFESIVAMTQEAIKELDRAGIARGV